MRRKLGHGMAGKAVALNKAWAGFGNRYVPGNEAHLRDLLGGLQAHGLGFLKKRNGKAHDGRTRHGMVGEGVALLVRAHGQQLAAVQVHAGRHAAAVHIIHDLAIANAQEGIHDPLLLIAQQGRNPDGVYRGRAEFRHAGVLNDPLL